MSSLETTRKELRSMLEALSASPELSINEALARMSEIVELAGADTLALEKEGRFAEAATLYGMIAEAFEIAARKVPEEGKQRVASLGDYWSLKANTMQVAPESVAEPMPQPPPYIQQRRDPTTDRLPLKMRRQGLALKTDEFGASAVISSQQAVDPEKLGEVQVGRGARVRVSPLPIRPQTLLFSEQIKRGTAERQSTRTKRLDFDRDSEDIPTPEKGA